MQCQTKQASGRSNLFFLGFFVLVIIVLAASFHYFKPSEQPVGEAYMRYRCNVAASYSYDFQALEWIEDRNCSVSNRNSWNPPSGQDYPTYCSQSWCLFHPMGGAGSEICAFQKCKKINGEYECQGGITLDELVENAVAGDTSGWLARDCPSQKDLIDADTCTQFGGLPHNNHCGQLEAARAWDINDQLDCEAAGGFWFSEPWFACMIPQDLLMKIDPGNPDAICGVEGEEACATLRWVKRPAGSAMRLHTLNISPR